MSVAVRAAKAASSEASVAKRIFVGKILISASLATNPWH
jgi:hypothetical protein